MADSTPSSAAYVVPTTEGGEIASLRERADRAEAEAERLRHIARAKQGPFYQVDKAWVRKYGPNVALLMAAIRNYTRLEYGVCFAKRDRIAKELHTSPDKIKHWSGKVQGSGEFFYAIRPGRTTVYALNQEALRAFTEGGESGKGARVVGRIHTGGRAKLPHDREQQKENQLSMYVYDAILSRGVRHPTAKELSHSVTIEEVEAGVAKGLTEGALVKYLRGEYIEPVKVRRSAANAYKQGQFADFWDK